MKNSRIYSTKRYNLASKLAVYAFFGVGLIFGTFIATNHCQATALTYEQLCSGYPDGELGVAGSPDWETTIEVDPDTDYMIFMIRLNDPYIATHYQGLTIDGEAISWLTYNTSDLKQAWYIMEAPDVITTTYYTLALDGDTGAGLFYVSALDYYQVSGISSYQGYDKDQTSGSSLTYTINFTDNDYTYLLGIGNTATLQTVDGGVIVRNDSGTHAIASSTPSLNNTITANFSNSVERGGVLFAFKTYLDLGLNYPEFATEPGLSYPELAICIYGEDCVIDFFYTNLDLTEETAIIEWTLVEDDSFLGSTTLNMALPFTWITLTVASSVGDFVGDLDSYWITISEDCAGDCEIYWQNFGMISWTGTTSSTTYDILPECDDATVCPYITASTSFWSVDNFACGFARAGCYLIKPSPRALDILRVLIKQEAYGYMSTPGDIQEELTAWEELEAPASTTIVLDMSNSLGKELTLLDSDDMQDLINEPIRNRIFLIINLCFSMAYLVGLFIEIAFLIHIKVL